MSQYTPQDIPYGFCHCGCGQKTTLAPQTSKEKGWIKGQPKKFLPFHHIKVQFAPAEQRFWLYTEKGNETDCWLWHGYRSNAGYGSLEVDGKTISAHRYSWTIHNGSIPGAMLVCHHCDNPSCVNPHHLFLGTDADNMHDMIAKGRNRRIGKKGESHPRSKLSDSDIRDMRCLAEQGKKQKDIAEIFGVSKALVCLIANRKIWKHI